MTPRSKDNPLLTDEEVARVLGRAARIDARAERGQLSVNEVIDVAREAGIRDEAVRRALSDVLAERVSAGKGHLGVPVHLSARAEVPRIIEQERLAHLGDVLRSKRRVGGTASVQEGELVWKDAEGARVTVVSRGEATQISATTSLEALSQSSLALFCVGGLLGAVYIAKILGAPSGGPMIGAAVAGVGAGVGSWRFYWRRKIHEWRERLGAIVTLLREEIEE